MKILVTGAAGRIGAATVAALLDQDHRVTGLDRRATGRDTAGYTEIVAELTDADALRQAVAGADVVLHLGAFMSWAAGDRAELYRSNVDGTRVLIEAAVAAGVGRFVFASSGEVYPETAPVQLPITETSPLRPTSDYGLTKLIGEEIVRLEQRRGTIETVILRFSHVQSASELLDEESFFSGPRFFLRPRIRQQETLGNHAVADLLHRHDPGEPAHVLARNEDGKPFRMHITETRDMVEGILLAMNHAQAAGGVFNLGATQPVQFEPLIDKMAAITGYPVVRVNLPGPGVDYCTANDHIREKLGYTPVWTIDRMLAEAATARQARSSG